MYKPIQQHMHNTYVHVPDTHMYGAVPIGREFMYTHPNMEQFVIIHIYIYMYVDVMNMWEDTCKVLYLIPMARLPVLAQQITMLTYAC